jgi:Mn-dependent DtxR family transcriptional regulator
MNQVEQLRKVFMKRGEVTVSHMKEKMGIKNPYETIRRLRESGYGIYTDNNLATGETFYRFVNTNWRIRKTLRSTYRLAGAEAYDTRR